MRNEQNRAAALFELEDLPETLALERLVPNGKDLVEEEDVGPQVRRDRKAESHVHPRRVGADRQVDELLQLGEGNDLIHSGTHVPACEPVDGPIR